MPRTVELQDDEIAIHEKYLHRMCTQKRRQTMITLNLPKKQVNAILVALDAEIEMQLGGRPVDWESFPEVAALMMAYYTTRCKFEEELQDG
tara:strand:- start:323 stop:595 length:273 start_codon:yes stop_codon:yes gene_type:complete